MSNEASPGFCGFMSILSSMRYCLGPADAYGPIWAALALMPFGLFFDFMDGKVARWRGKSSLMGQELDSLADLVRRSTAELPYTITAQYAATHDKACGATSRSMSPKASLS